MECLEFRRLCGADPDIGDLAFVQHAESCERCGDYAREIRVLDDLILRALKVEVPPAAGDPFEDRGHERISTWRQARWLGLAASLILAVIVGTGIWGTLPTDTLAGEVVEHILHEPKSLSESAVSVASEDIYKVLAGAGYALQEEIGIVTYSRTCIFRGYEVPHLVVQGQRGPITVMLLPDISIVQPISVSESGFSGSIIPFDKGSLAVVGEHGEEQLGQMTQRLVDGIGKSR